MFGLEGIAKLIDDSATSQNPQYPLRDGSFTEDHDVSCEQGALKQFVRPRRSQ